MSFAESDIESFFQVHFLHEEELVEFVQRAVEAKLVTANASRTFYTQTVLPGLTVASLDGAAVGAPSAVAVGKVSADNRAVVEIPKSVSPAPKATPQHKVPNAEFNRAEPSSLTRTAACAHECV